MFLSKDSILRYFINVFNRRPKLFEVNFFVKETFRWMFQPGKIVLIVIPKIVLKELYYEKFAPPLSKHLIKVSQHQVRSSLIVVWRTYVSAGVIRPV